ncbi:xanthine dehydrogenase family protein molybdopterin-binding subunit [Thermaerobacter sp. PB12/4term]|uniref:xanthine dehydrogenase family protein molybdopterin-binding subunit n=1 Tax=Thermaerobacter sp. PB12/4term TaxID=2293838 RepID=UPI000E325E63|nr:xanthine dehydrogenase family protein molybdopterin-binding subunit [Thermaerobacter sp. PB12/4term]QIA27311.1 xanthine dehydrogenase family protein molybdopterin-binding subunit [Thermaerobacter sp. PB12/4term]
MPRLVKTRFEFEGRVQERFVVVEDDPAGPLPGEGQLRYIGRPVPRMDGWEKVTGRARYTHDVRLPGMVHAMVVRSPYPHARIRSVRAERALAIPGVLAVLTHENCPPIPWGREGDRVLNPVVRYHGDEVAVVAARDLETARAAAAALEVEYEPLPFVVDLEEAMKPDAPPVRPQGNVRWDRATRYSRGDLEAGFREAEVVVEGTFRTPVQLHNCMETHGSVVDWQQDRVTIYDSTQHLFGVRDRFAQLFGLPVHRVRVVKEHMGGGFGSKNGLHKYTVLAGILSRELGRPVRCVLDREEENLAAGNRHSTLQRLKLGARADGRLVALDLEAYAAVGVLGSPGSIGGPARQLYAIPNVRTVEVPVHTNTGPTAAFRAPGYVEGTVALEVLMDELARRLVLDPLELRLRNYAEVDPTSGRPYSSKGLRQAYAMGAAMAGWQAKRGGRGWGVPGVVALEAAAQGAGGDGTATGTGAGAPATEGPGGPVAEGGAGRRRRLRGIGMASQIWGGAGGPPAQAEVRVHPDGTATVVTAGQDIGTGTRTVLAQIAAEELALPLERVRVQLGDTDGGPYAPISAGSMTVPSMGPAVRSAAADAARQILELAGGLLEADPRDLELVPPGRVQVRGAPDRAVTFQELGKTLGQYVITGRGSRGPNPDEYAIHTFGAQFAEVEVDPATGEVRVLDLWAVHDIGRVVNPLTAAAQMEGGMIQGLGFALMEERVMDPLSGRVLNPNLENYRVPTVADIPRLHVAFTGEPDPHGNNLGVKGAGEPPIIPTAAAIANAFYHATGIPVRELPLTRQRVLALLRRHGIGPDGRRQPQAAGGGDLR